jgi:hypothetical protein
MPAKKKTTGASGTRRPRTAKEKAPPPPPAAESPFTASSFTPGMSQDCLMCPFGLFYFTMRNTRPEVMEHLTAAGHELFLAFRALVEQTGERWDQAQSLQRITVR